MQRALRRRAAAGTVGPRAGSPGGLERARKAPRRRWRCALGLAARGGRDAGDAVLGIWDALVVHAEEELAERFLDPFDVAEREVAFVELTVADALVDDSIDHPADRLGILLAERAHRRLRAVREHHDAGLLALWTRSGIAERALVGCLSGLLRYLEEVLHDARYVMARDQLADPRRKPVAVGESQAILDVRGHDARGHERIEFVVRVLTGLVLDERGRVPHLADVVVVGADSSHERIGADDLRG